MIVGGDDLLTEDYWRAAGDAADGTLLTFPPDARDNPEAAKVVEGFRKAGSEPEGYTLCTYAAVQVWAAAAAAAGSTDFDKVTAALAKGQLLRPCSARSGSTKKAMRRGPATSSTSGTTASTTP